MTTDLIHASAAELQLASQRQSAIACLPAQIMHAASQFTSSDVTKQALHYVHVFQTDATVTIQATDGHRAFRVRLTDSSHWYVNGSLLIRRDAFYKKTPHGIFAIVKDGGTFDILGGKSSASTKTPPTTFLETRPWATTQNWTFPALDQLWPDKFTNECGDPIAFNAEYLSHFMKIVSNFSERGVVKMETNKPNNPVIFSSDCALYGCTNARLEYLIMPVLIRN